MEGSLTLQSIELSRGPSSGCAVPSSAFELREISRALRLHWVDSSAPVDVCLPDIVCNKRTAALCASCTARGDLLAHCDRRCVQFAFLARRPRALAHPHLLICLLFGQQRARVYMIIRLTSNVQRVAVLINASLPRIRGACGLRQLSTQVHADALTVVARLSHIAQSCAQDKVAARCAQHPDGSRSFQKATDRAPIAQLVIVLTCHSKQAVCRRRRLFKRQRRS